MNVFSKRRQSSSIRRASVRYVAFISYRHSTASRPHAERLEAALKRYAKPLWKPPIAIFRDERVLRPGDDLPSEIGKALNGSEFLLYLASKEAARSEWVQDELRIWCEELGRADRLLIIHIGDRITSDRSRGTILWEETDALPDLLKPYVQSIPIWTDLSWATAEEQRDLNNVEYKKAINAITARFRGKRPGEMNDEEVLTHRRNVRLRNAAVAAVVLFALLATYFGDRARRDRNAAVAANQSAQKERNAAVTANEVAQQQRAAALAANESAQRERLAAVTANGVAQEQRKLAEDRARRVELAEAFRMMDRGNENLRNQRGGQAKAQFDGAAGLLARLALDPLMALHSSLVARTGVLAWTPITDVEGEVSEVVMSRDGDLIAVIYDYQDNGGNPDLEDIPDHTAAGIFQRSARKWTVKQSIGSPVGQKAYAMPSQIIGVEAPHDLILSRGDDEATRTFVRFSLADGSERPCDEPTCGEYAESVRRSLSNAVPTKLEPVVDDASLYTTHPDDGIDEYSPRLVDKVFVTSPDGRTAIVGTYEGRLLLLDLAAGRVRGDERFTPIFAAAYRRDGQRAVVADRRTLFEIDTSSYPGIRETASPLQIPPPVSGNDEAALASALSDDGTLLAVATTRHLIALDLPKNRSMVWELPGHIEKAAALRIDVERHAIDLVVGDDGSLISADYRSPALPLKTSSLPSGKQPAVAWLDPKQPAAWVSDVTAVDGSVRVRKVALPGYTAPPLEMSIRLRTIDTGSPVNEAPAVHAIAKLDEQLVLFHGDADAFGERELWDETMTSIPLGGPAHRSDRMVFATETTVDNLGEPHWSASHVDEVLPGSSNDRILARVGTEIVTITTEGRIALASDSLAARDYVDHDQTYTLHVSVKDAQPSLSIQHLGSGTVVQLEVPWSFEAKPAFAVITPKGRQVAVVSSKGDAVVVDASSVANRMTAVP